jgi:F-box protein 9
MFLKSPDIQWITIVYFRYLVKNTYVPPQVQKPGIQDVLVKRFKEDYRQFYIEHPRLRMDGVYIAVCHYVWVCPSSFQT